MLVLVLLFLGGLAAACYALVVYVSPWTLLALPAIAVLGWALDLSSSRVQLSTRSVLALFPGTGGVSCTPAALASVAWRAHPFLALLLGSATFLLLGLAMVSARLLVRCCPLWIEAVLLRRREIKLRWQVEELEGRVTGLERPPPPPGVVEAARLQRRKEISAAVRQFGASEPRVLGAARDRLAALLRSASVNELRRTAERQPGGISPPAKGLALMARLELLRRENLPPGRGLAAPGRGPEAVRTDLAAARGDLETVVIARTRGEHDLQAFLRRRILL